MRECRGRQSQSPRFLEFWGAARSKHPFQTPQLFSGWPRPSIMIQIDCWGVMVIVIRTISTTALVFAPAASGLKASFLVRLLTMNRIKVIVERFNVLPATIYRIQNKNSTFKLRDLGSQSLAGRSSFDLILDSEGNALPLEGDEYKGERTDMM
jgi:hypothetical protein